MAKRKLPFDAFEYYFALGHERSYEAVAEHFQVSKTAVANLAKREQWQDRVVERERKAREALDQKSIESVEQMNERHLKLCKVMQKKSFEALRAMPLATGMDAIRGLELAIRQERLIRGEPSERTAVTRTEEEIDSLIEKRREVDRAMREFDRREDMHTHRLRLANERGNGVDDGRDDAHGDEDDDEHHDEHDEEDYDGGPRTV